MSWTAPRTWVAGELVTAALFNTHIRDNESELRSGGLAIASQAAQDFLYASSATALGRLAAVSGKSPRYTGAAWAMVDYYPVGSIYINASDATNPGTLLGFGTWTAFGSGRVMVGLDSGDTDFNAPEETGGAKTVTLTTAQVPALTVGLSNGSGASNTIGAVTGTTQDDSVTTTTGSGGAHTNLQPYIVVYMWKRTA